MSTLLTAMQCRVAFRTLSVETGAGQQRGGATVAAGCGNRLYETGEAGSGYIERGFRTLGFEGSVPVAVRVAIAIAIAFGVVIAVLPILTIAIHEFRREPPVMRVIG